MSEKHDLFNDVKSSSHSSSKYNGEDTRAFMLNAVWFKSNGGESRYRDYLKKVSPLIHKVGGRKLKSFVADRQLVGEFDADLLFFIEYPNWQAFKDFANSAEYHKLAYIREEALEKQILVRCVRPDRSFWG